MREQKPGSESAKKKAPEQAQRTEEPARHGPAPRAPGQDLLQLQRTLGNRATGRYLAGAHGGRQRTAQRPSAPLQRAKAPIIQRYRLVSKDSYALTKDTSENARAPFTRFEADLTTQPAKEGKEAMGMGWAKHLDDQPPLNAAEDNSLAINASEGEPKEFYAAGGVIAAANRELKGVNSPIELFAAGNKVTLPGKLDTDPGTELVMVQPKLTGKEDPGKDAFIALNNNICRDVAKEIMGGSISHALLRDEEGVKAAPIGVTDGTVVTGIHSLAQDLTQGEVDKEQGAQSITDEEAEPKVGKEYGKASRAGTISPRAKEIGVNEFASAKVGQGYLTQSIFDSAGSKTDYAKGDDETNEFVWGYHFSAVVAESLDAKDQIAMENYNRMTSEMKIARAELLKSLKARFAEEIKAIKLEGNDANQVGQIIALVDNKINANAQQAMAAYTAMVNEYMGKMSTHWYFRIIGQGKGQSFHEQMSESPFFVNPLTVAVANRYINASAIPFEEGKSTLSEAATGKVKDLAGEIKSAIARGLSPAKIKLTGHGSGWKGTGLGAAKIGLARANAVKEGLKAQGVPEGLLEAVGGDRVDSEKMANNRKVDVEIED